MTDFRLTWHAPGGDQVLVGDPLPRQTLEGGTVAVSIPSSSTLAAPPPVRPTAFAFPNPARSGAPVQLALPVDAGESARIYDLAGRQVAALALARVGDVRAAQWRTLDARGRALPAGIYQVRASHGAAARVVLLSP